MIASKLRLQLNANKSKQNPNSQITFDRCFKTLLKHNKVEASCQERTVYKKQNVRSKKNWIRILAIEIAKHIKNKATLFNADTLVSIIINFPRGTHTHTTHNHTIKTIGNMTEEKKRTIFMKTVFEWKKRENRRAKKKNMKRPTPNHIHLKASTS